MVRDLPDIYKNEGYVGSMLEDCLKRDDAITWVRVSIDYHSTHGWNCGTETSFFSRGDFRPDAIEVGKELLSEKNKHSELEEGDEGIEGKLPQDWENKILNSKKVLFEIKGTDGLALSIGAMDLKRVAEIAKDGNVKNPIYDKGYQIVNKKDFLIEFRGSIADQLLNSNRYGSASKIQIPPNEKKLAKMIKEAREVFDHYTSIPINSMIVTKDFIFPYVIGRKKSRELKLHSRYCGYSWKGPRISTGDPCVHLTGIDKDCAPHMYKNPVFRANFGFPMDIIKDTFIVSKKDEKTYVQDAIDSMGKFNTIWVQSPPANLPKDMITYNGNNWYPKKDELVKVINQLLGVK